MDDLTCGICHTPGQIEAAKMPKGHVHIEPGHTQQYVCVDSYKCLSRVSDGTPFEGLINDSF